MELCHSSGKNESQALAQLDEFLSQRRRAWGDAPPEFEVFERELHVQVMNLERELIAEELARYDVAAEEIEVGGQRYQRVLAAGETYLSAAGPIRVERHLYRPPGHNPKSVCPLELRAGIIVGHWTPRAARQAALAMALMTPGEAETLFAEIGNQQPSCSTLDRLPRNLSSVWESRREEWEAALRVQESVPAEAVVVAFSLDGVMAPMKADAAQRQAKREQPGKHASGPAGQREVGCGVVTLYDAQGERLQTLRYARMPQTHKLTLRQQLAAEGQAILVHSPQLRRVLLADGAPSNWTWLAQLDLDLGGCPGEAVLIVDFYHACDHLKSACDAIWGESTPESQAEFARLKTLLKEADDGADRVIGALRYRVGRATGNRRKRIQAELTYFRNQKPRMAYADYVRENLPIASGVIEATCKTLVTQRLKRSGMAWTPAGGQAILTLRSLIQSDRWEPAWTLLAADFCKPVIVLHGQSYPALPLAV
jgi:hypothetical protein